MTETDKTQIAALINRWRDRSGLNLSRQVIPRMETRGCEIDYDDFYNLFLRLEKTTEIPPDIIVAVIAAFSEGAPQHERCTAEEAIDLARLTRLPIDQFAALKEFFPADEFNQAYSRYALIMAAEPGEGPPTAVLLDLKPLVQVSRAGSSQLVPAEFAMPLYPGDTLHTHAGAHAIFLCQESQLLFQMPELSLQGVNCQAENDPRVLGRLRTILQAANKADPPPPLIVAETAASYNLTVNNLTQSYWLSQFHQEHAQWTKAFEVLARLVEEQNIISSYLQQQLGTLAVEIGDYTQAENHFQAALTLAEANANPETQAAAYLGLAVTSFYRGDIKRAEHLFQTLALISPKHKAVELAKILLKAREENIDHG